MAVMLRIWVIFPTLIVYRNLKKRGHQHLTDAPVCLDVFRIFMALKVRIEYRQLAQPLEPQQQPVPL